MHSLFERSELPSFGVRFWTSKSRQRLPDLGPHELCLAPGVAAGEHFAVVVASIDDESPGYVPVRSRVTGLEAGRGNVLSGEKHAAKGDEDRLSLHVGRLKVVL